MDQKKDKEYISSSEKPLEISNYRARWLSEMAFRGSQTREWHGACWNKPAQEAAVDALTIPPLLDPTKLKAKRIRKMKARKVAAQFAAYTWYQENRTGQQSSSEAIRFARENWTAFLAVADEGWGQLLLRLSSERAKRHGKPVSKRYRCLAS
jgi:hypothetical protein